MVFQAVGVTLGPLLNFPVSMPSIDRDLFGEQLEMNLVAIPSAIQPEKEHDRHLQDAREPHGSGRESCMLAEELAGRGLILLQEAIRKNAHHPSAVQTFLDLQHRAGRAGLYYRVGDRRIQVLEEVTDHRCILLVHQNLDVDIPLGQPDGTHDLEAPQMRPEQETSPAASQAVREHVESPYIDVEASVCSGKKIHAIKERRRETMILPIQVAPADRAPQRSNQVGSDGTTCWARKY